METLTKSQIKMIMALVERSKDNSEALMNYENNVYRALHKLEFENMVSIYNKLEKTLNKDCKRISIK